MFCNVRKGTRFYLKLIIISLLFHPPHVTSFISRSQVSLSSSSPAAAPYPLTHVLRHNLRVPVQSSLSNCRPGRFSDYPIAIDDHPHPAPENNFHTLLYSIPRTAPSFIKAFCVKSSRAKCECPSISLCCSEEEMFHTVCYGECTWWL